MHPTDRRFLITLTAILLALSLIAVLWYLTAQSWGTG